jgi:molybdate transport system regulatory protein
VRLYREMERRAYGASSPEIRSLTRLLTPPDVKLH